MANRSLILFIALAAISLTAGCDFDSRPELKVAISLDMPPYVMENGTDGLEVEIARRALPGYELIFVRIPYGELDDAVQRGVADAAVGVKCCNDGAHYSNDYITFANAAFTRKEDGIQINGVSDLAGKPVLTWQDAYRELDAEFDAMYQPGGPERGNYTEYADQAEQVETFWESAGTVAVIDRAIFRYYTEKLAIALDKADLHSIFPSVTDSKVAFNDAAVRDAFNAELAALCRNGGYDAILDGYGVVVERTVCEE